MSGDGWTYTAWGPVRGGCGHRHRQRVHASACAQRDRRACARQGGQSDRLPYRVDEHGGLLTWSSNNAPLLHNGSQVRFSKENMSTFVLSAIKVENLTTKANWVMPVQPGETWRQAAIRAAPKVAPGFPHLGFVHLDTAPLTYRVQFAQRRRNDRIAELSDVCTVKLIYSETRIPLGGNA